MSSCGHSNRYRLQLVLQWVGAGCVCIYTLTKIRLSTCTPFVYSNQCSA